MLLKQLFRKMGTGFRNNCGKNEEFEQSVEELSKTKTALKIRQ